MDQYRRLRDACGLGAKAHQNLVASLKAFERLIALGRTDDYVLSSSLFQTAVIRYAKPFVNTKLLNGLTVRYPVKHLKDTGFDEALHDHLIKIRNTLIAHDDFEQIKPRLHFGCMTETTEKEEVFVPMAVTIINKCLMHPADMDDIAAMARHVAATLEGIVIKLRNDLEDLRRLIIEKPEETEKFLSKMLQSEKFKIPEDGVAVVLPDISGDQRFAPSNPDFDDIHSGFRYETGEIRMTFREG